MKIIPLKNKEEWNDVVKGFEKWDIYYLNEYAHSFFIHGDGDPYLIYLSDNKGRMAYVVMQSDISGFGPFRNVLEKDTYFDWSTPYGYGGPLFEGDIDELWMKKAEKEISAYAKKHNIISEFFRFNPLLQNQKSLEKNCHIVYLKKTIYMDTSDRETIQANMIPTARNMFRKAKKNGIEIIMDQGEHLEEFMYIYNETMKHKKADEYYYFKRSYFEDIIKNMQKNIIFFYALYENKIISASIFFYNDNYMHYHLSGTLSDYRRLASTNLILTEAAYWAYEHGIKQFHLGGGVDSEDDLFRFKKHFNRNGLIDFYIGRKIFMPEKFRKLVEIRKKADESFDEKKNFLILYRG